MKQVVSISLGSSSSNYEFSTRFLSQSFLVRRFGTDGDLERARQLLEEWQAKADVVGIGQVRDHAHVGTLSFTDRRTARLEEVVTRCPVTTGAMLRSFLQEWAVRYMHSHLGSYFTNARVLFLSGLTNYRIAQVMAEYTPNLTFADPLIQLGAPKLLTSLKALELYAAGSDGASRWVPKGVFAASRDLNQRWNRYILRKALQAATVVVGDWFNLKDFGLEELAGKIVLTSSVSAERERFFREAGVSVLLDSSPQLFPQVVALNVLEAMIMASLGRSRDELCYDDCLEIASSLDLKPRVIFPQGSDNRVNRFAFVIHPLSQEYFKKVKPVEVLSQVTPPAFMTAVEKIMAWAPPFVYSRVTGIKSPTGVEAEGWLISVGGTPRELMSHSPEFTYRRLLAAAKMARKLGAQIMGLGAFTKVVGDAGVTVARRAELPITTGNSYSASGALWAAADAVRRMGLIPLQADKKIPGKAMIVGATGAIGSVCTRLLAMAVAEVYLVSPETAKLLALRETILQETPGARVHLMTKPDPCLGQMDVIVTATSGAGKKVLDIMKVKPGCVITDVARPLDLPPSEVAKRPDVLVIESGEIRLPGTPRMRNIGLPPGVAYACLAETIVLALEGRFENYTVGRNIEWAKVKEIYQLGLKHGMQLAAISGVNGVFSDEDIQRVRELALEARKKRRDTDDCVDPCGQAVLKEDDLEPPPAVNTSSPKPTAQV